MMKRKNIFSIIPGRWILVIFVFIGLQWASFIQAQNDCIFFTGSQDYIAIPDNPSQSFGSGNFTISFWMTLSNLNSTSDGLFGKNNVQWLAMTYNYNSDRRLNLWISQSGSGWDLNNLEPAKNDWVQNQWYNIAIVRNGNTIQIFINGVLSASANYPYPVYDPTGVPLYFGRAQYSTWDHEGNIDEIRIWNYALSEYDLLSSMNSQLTGEETGLVTYFNCNQTSGLTAYNSVPNSVNATLYNNASFVVSTAPVTQTMVNGPFVPVIPTGLPYNIILTGITIDGIQLPLNSQIAVYDGATCVGSAVYSSTGNLQIVTWQQDVTNGFPGFTPGDPITFKVRTTWYSAESIFAATSIFSSGNGTFGNGVLSAASLTVTTGLAPSISTTTNEVNFNAIPVNTSLTEPLIISNTGNAILNVTALSAGSTVYSFSSNSGFINPGKTDTVQITFLPVAVQDYQMPLTITSDDPLNSLYTVTLNGIGLAQATPAEQISPAVLIFDSVGTGTSITQTFNIVNQGNGPLTVSSITSTNGSYTISGPTSFTLTQFQNKNIPVTFSPTSTGYFSAQINITDNNGNHSVTVYGFSFILHYTPVASTGMPYNIIIQSASIDGKSPNYGDQIAVMDNGLCVGSAVISGGMSALLGSSSSMITIPAVNLPSSGFTTEAWVIFPLPNYNYWKSLFDDGNSQYQIMFDGSNNLGLYDNGFYSSGYNTNSLSPGWHHIAAVASGSTTTFYMDGNIVGTVPIVNSNPVICLGNYTGGSQNIGIADEFKIWNYAFTEDQIRTDMNKSLTGSETGLLGYWSFNDGTARDLSPNGKNGTLSGGTSIVNFGAIPGNISLVAWQSVPALSLPGFVSGHNMSFAIWTELYSQYMQLNAIPTYSVGNGTFGYGQFSVASLTATDTIKPKISFNKSKLYVGQILVNTTTIDSFMIYNKGNATLQVQLIENSPQFTVNVSNANITQNDSLKVRVTFNPTVPGNYATLLNIYTNDPDTLTIPYLLEGFALPPGVPKIGLSLKSINFGGVINGNNSTNVFNVINKGSATLNVTGISSSSAFFSASPATFNIVNTNGNQQIQVTFSPVTRGSYSALIIVTSNGGIDTVSLTGVGYNGYFSPVASTGLPYFIVIEKGNLLNYLHIGDEIAVYDGTQCVGSSPILQDTGNIQVVAWQASPANGLPGFTAGHPITIKVYGNINGFNSQFNTTATFIVGNGTFGNGPYSVAKLTLQSPDISFNPNQFFVALSDPDSTNEILQINNTGAGNLYVNSSFKYISGPGSLTQYYSVLLNGTNNYVECGNWSPGSIWTVEAWVNPSSLPSGRRTIVGGVSSCEDWGIQMQNGYLGATDLPYSGCSETYTSPTLAIAGQWVHLAETCDGDSSRLYINGQFIASRRVSTNYTGYADTRIGGEACCAGNNFPGYVDEVRIWNYPRTGAQLQSTMYTPLKGTETGLLAYYNFNNGTANDLTGKHNGSFQDGAAVAPFNAPVYSWLTLIPYADTIASGNSRQVTLQFNTTGLIQGLFTGDLILNNNTLDSNNVIIPVSLNVTGNAQIFVSDSSINLGQILINKSDSVVLNIQNIGSKNLIIDSIYIRNASINNFKLSGLPALPCTMTPVSGKNISVIFNPNRSGVQNDTLIIYSNNGGKKYTKIPLTGNGLLPAKIQLGSTSWSHTLLSGTFTEDTLIIYNRGQANLTFTITGSAPWLSLNITSGTITVNDSAIILLNVSANGIYAGKYSRMLTVNSNDPNTPHVNYNINLTVTGHPEISTAGSLNMGNVFINTTKIFPVLINNTGTDTLFIDSVNISNTIFIPITTDHFILPGKTDSIEISFTPDVNAPFSGLFTIYSNAQTNPVWTVGISGQGVRPQTISVLPTLFDQVLTSGESKDYTLSITNSGDLPLNYTLTINLMAGNALSMNGSGDYITAVDAPALNPTSAITIEAWLNLNSNTDNFIVSKELSSIGSYRLFINSSGYYQFTLNGNKSVISTVQASTNSWEHIAASFDGQTLYLYINGVQNNSATYEPFAIETNTDNLRIGRSFAGEYLDGKIDEFRIWNVYQNASEIQTYYQETLKGNESGLILYYNFNESSGIICMDQSPSGINATMYGSTTRVPSDAPVDNVLSLSSYSGTVIANSSRNITVTLQSFGLTADTFQQNILVNSNDPVHPAVNIPVTVIVSGAAKFNLPSDSLIFGNTFYGFTDTLDLILNNTGASILSVGSTNILKPAFKIPQWITEILPFSYKGVEIIFAPATTGIVTDTLHFTTGDPTAPNVKVLLKGTATPPPIITLSQDTVNFNTVIVGFSGNDSIIAKNTGVSPLVINSMTVTNSPIYTFTNIAPVTITTGDSAVIYLTFTPTDYFDYNAQLTLNTNIGKTVIPLSGSGVRPGNDVGVLELISPISGCTLSDTNTVRLFIRNYGSNKESSFNVGYSINGGPAVIENVGTSPIPSGGGRYFSFSTKANLKALGTYNINAYTMLSNDLNRSNDTLFDTIANYPALQINVSPNQSICSGNNVTLNAAAIQSTFTWSTGSNNAYINVSPATNTNYTVTAVNTYGCTASDTINVTVLPLPTPPIIAAEGNTTICSYQSVTLLSNITGVKWSTGNSQQQINVSQNGSYYATITDSHGCKSASNNINVTVEQVPSLVVNGATTLCRGDFVQLTVNNAIKYNWSTNDTVQTINVSPLHDSVFYVSMTTAIGCTYEDSVLITVINPVAPGIVTNMLPANGSLNVFEPIQFSWPPASNASNYDLYIWNSLDIQPSTPTVANINTINYTYQTNLNYGNTYNWMVTARNSCQSTNGVIQSFTLRYLPDLVVENNILDPRNIYSGQSLTVSWQTENIGQGSTNSQQWQDGVYLSLDSILSDNDIFLGSAGNVSYLLPGQSYLQTATFQVPSNLIGNYYVLVDANYQNQLEESNTSNNYSFNPKAPLLAIMPQPLSDLTVNSIGIPTSIFSGNTILVNYQVNNIGPVSAQGSNTQSFLIGNTYYTEHYWTDGIYISSQPTFNVNTALKLTDVYVGLRSRLNPPADLWYSVPDFLMADSSYSEIIQVTVPVTYSGTYYIYVFTDENFDVEESHTHNNVLSSQPLSVILTPPAQLDVDTVAAPATAQSSQAVQISYTVSNIGGNPPLVDNWQDNIYISTLDTFNVNQSTLLQTEYINGGLQLYPGNFYQENVTVNLPNGVSGKYYVYVLTDATDVVFEYTYRQNNIGRSVIPIKITLAPYPDLLVKSVQMPDTSFVPTVVITWQVKNTGPGIALAPWTDRVFISTDPTWNPANVTNLSSVAHTTNLVTDGIYTQTDTLTLPAIANGRYYFYVYTDIFNQVYEYHGGPNWGKTTLYYRDTVTSANNSGSGNSSLPTVDTTRVNLAVTNFNSPPSTGSGDNIPLSWTVENIGDKVSGNVWYDYVYLSTTNVVNSSSILLDYQTHSGAIAPGQSYSVSRSFTIPNGIYGTYFIFLDADALMNNTSDTARSNNYAGNQIVIHATPPPDLAVESFVLSPTLIAGQQVVLPYTVTNTGTGGTVTTAWQDITYISSTPDLQPGTYVQVASLAHQGALNPHNSYNDTMTFYVPQYLAGYFYFVVKTDAYNQVYEPNRDSTTNNSVVDILVPNPSDLIITALSIPSTVILGQDVSVFYNIKNIGANPAIGNLSNAVYFSPDTVFKASVDPMLGSEQSYINLNPGDSIIRSISSMMPGVVPGAYYGIGRTNILNSIVESNINNDMFITDSTIQVTVNTLYLNIPANFKLDIGELVYYKVNVPKNLDLIITLTGNQSFGSNEVYVAYNRVPSTNDFDYLFQNPGEVNQTVLVPSTQAGDYYILVRTPTNYNGLQQATLLARALPFSIISISPDTVGNGNVTTEINGAAFRSYTKFYLLSPDSSIIDSATNVSLENSMQASVNWDFTNIAFGTYPVMAVNNDTTKYIYPTGITVVQSTGYMIQFTYDAPNMIRLNGNASYAFYYTNTGNVDIPFIKGDYTIPTYTNIISETTAGNVITRGQLILDSALGPINNWIDFDGYRYIPFIAKNISPGASFSVNMMFRGFGNSAVFPLRARAYGFSTQGFLTNQLNMAEGARENMLTNPDQFGVNQNPTVMNLLTSSGTWRDSILNFYVGTGLLKSSDTTGFIASCSACNTGFGTTTNNSNSSTYEPSNGNGPGIATYIQTAFSSGEDYLWVINNYNGSPGGNPGWDMVVVSGQLDVTSTAQNPFVIHLASIDYNNQPAYLSGWYPVAKKSWPIAVANGGIIGFDTSKIVLDLSRFTAYNALYNGKFYLSMTGADTLLLNFSGDTSLNGTGIQPSPSHQIPGTPSGNIPCGRSDDLVQSTCDEFFNILSCANAQSDCFSSFIVASTNPISGPKGVAVTLFGTSSCGLEISSCTNSLVSGAYQSPNSINGVDLLGCAASTGSSPLISCTGQYICNQVVQSCDPNAISGPRGFGPGRYIAIEETMPYTISFENSASFATSSAQRVTITEQLDPNLNPLSFRVKDFGFGNYNFTVPYNTASYFNTIDLPDSLGYDLQVTAGINIQTNQAIWVFQTIDPKTGLPPVNPLIGFLPINDSLGSGDGYVNYTVQPKQSSVSGDSIHAFATIVFDINQPIVTPTIFNKIDKDAPVSSVDFLSSVNGTLTIPLSIYGYDEVNGSGVDYYELYVSTNNSNFILYGDYLPDEIIQFPGQQDDTYQFFSIAVDNVGHVEPMKYVAEAATQVKLADVLIKGKVKNVSCFGNHDGSITLTVIGGQSPYTFSWSNDSTTQNLTNLGVGNYKVTVTDTRDSTSVDSFTVYSPRQIILNLGHDTTVLGNQPFVLNASPIYDTYLWSDSSINSTLAVTQTGTYWVRVSFNQCDASDSISVFVVPALNLADTIKICSGLSATIDAGPGYNSYHWSTGVQTQSINVDSAGTYSIWVEESGIKDYDTVIVVLMPKPIVNLGNDTALFVNDSLVLTAPSFDSYLWSDNSTKSTLTVKQTGTYWVNVTSFGCSASDTINVYFVQPLDLIDTITICSGLTATINAGAGWDSYHWSTGAQTQSIGVKTAGVYSVWVNKLGLKDYDTVVVNLLPAPVIVFGKDTSLRNIDSLTLFAPLNDLYLWSDSSTGDSLQILKSGTYWLKATAPDQCSTTDTIQVIFVVPINLGDTMKICSGLTAILNAGPGYNSYHWNTGDQTQSITVDTAGKYTVWAVINGYIDYDSVIVTILPTTIFSLGPDTTLLVDQTYTLYAPKGNFNYSWNNGSTADSIVVVANNYTDTVLPVSVSVTNSYLCHRSDTIDITINLKTGITLNTEDVTVYLYPNPVKDNLNVEFINLEGTIEIDLQNMMGQVIFEKQISSISSHMYFTIDLTNQPTGMYIIRFKNNKGDWKEKILKIKK